MAYIRPRVGGKLAAWGKAGGRAQGTCISASGEEEARHTTPRPRLAVDLPRGIGGQLLRWGPIGGSRTF